MLQKVLQSGWVSAILFVTTAQAQTQIGFKDKGHASYYASKFQGRKTANGEKYQNEELTAAHRTLPFNTMLKVTNTANGKEVVVRVNDRGPFSKHRLLDLSQAAARQLDMIRTGTAKVTIEVIGIDRMVVPPDEERPFMIMEPLAARKAQFTPPAPRKELPGLHPSSSGFLPGHCYSQWGSPKSPGGYGVQVGSYTKLEHAKDVCRELSAKKMDSLFIAVDHTQGNVLYRVVAGDFAQRREATSYLKTLQASGFDGFIKKHLSNN